MKIKYEMLKKSDCIEIYENVDEFYKMHFDCVIDDNFNCVNDVFQLSQKLQLMYASYETFKNELKHNDINNYIVVCDFENENIYIYDKNTNNIYDVQSNCIFTNDFTLCKIDNINEKYNLMCLFFNVMLINE